MEDPRVKAEVLMEALPYIKEYHGQTIVIKYGGNAMVSEELKESVATDIVLMKLVGISPVIVHGGGPQITDYMKKLSKEAQFVKGLRVTDAETMEIVQMVLVGKINKELVSLINRHGCLSVGISGEDGRFILAEKISGEGELGFVGNVKKINTKIVENLIKENFIPVIASIGTDERGQSYNINADLAAGEIAASLQANKVIFLTDVDGLYHDFKDKSSLISQITIEECEERMVKGEISEGMIPKIKGSLIALKRGVERAHILNGTLPHALLLEIFTDEGIGTMITK